MVHRVAKPLVYFVRPCASCWVLHVLRVGVFALLVVPTTICYLCVLLSTHENWYAFLLSPGVHLETPELEGIFPL